MHSTGLEAVCESVADGIDVQLDPYSVRGIGGGDISAAWRISDTSGTDWFLKTRSGRVDLFEAECDGLEALAQAADFRVPAVAGSGETDARAWLLLEWLELRPPRDDERCGRALAAMHRRQGPRFGWHRDNYIGATPQFNAEADNWIDFYRSRRLEPQLQRALANGAPASLASALERVANDLDAWFDDAAPVPSLVHGDLWGGNRAELGDGTPVLCDPAAYYGDRETDLAMTRLFGGFGERFYAAYDEAWPRAAGAAERETLYQLYHVLNHFNLFGGGYLSQAAGMIDTLLARR